MAVTRRKSRVQIDGEWFTYIYIKNDRSIKQEVIKDIECLKNTVNNVE